MDEMIGNAEEFYQSLGIPYRVVNIVSGREESRGSYCVNIILSKEGGNAVGSSKREGWAPTCNANATQTVNIF